MMGTAATKNTGYLMNLKRAADPRCNLCNELYSRHIDENRICPWPEDYPKPKSDSGWGE